MVNKFLKLASTLTIVAWLASLTNAQEGRIYKEGGSWTQEITGTLPAAKSLHVRVDIGAVKVQGGSQSGISYVIRNNTCISDEAKSRREFEDYKISASMRGTEAWIVGEWHGGRTHKFTTEFVIKVPRDLELVKAETEGGDVTATQLAGRVEAQSGGGSLHLDDIGGSIRAETGGGSIDVGTAGSDLNLQTGGGSIQIRSAKGKINAESGGGSVVLISGLQGAVLQTGGGSIEVKQCNGKVKASTGGGSIDLGEIGGPAEIETGGGSIRLASAKGPVRAETGGGSIELNGVTSARAETGGGGIIAKFLASSGERTDSVLETSAGDIVVYLAPDVALTIRASIDLANGHGIRTDFPDNIHVRSEGGDWGPKTVTAEGQLNGGGPMLKVRTTTGDIRILRASR
jgi:DUF4097 and DUF4098 domain-containing protein YvlB